MTAPQVAASVGPEIKEDYEEATAKPFSLNFTELFVFPKTEDLLCLKHADNLHFKCQPILLVSTQKTQRLFKSVQQ